MTLGDRCETILTLIDTVLAGGDSSRPDSQIHTPRTSALAGAETSLAVIQRDVPVPLEFEVMTSRTAYCWSPSQLVTVVLSALADNGRGRTR